MVTREDIFKYAKEKLGTKPEYLWEKFPKYAALKHDSNGKWFGLIMNILPEKIGLEGESEIDVLNLKLPPEWIGPLTERKDIFPGYHMNREYWVSVVLERVEPKEDFYQLIETSYDLTRK